MANIRIRLQMLEGLPELQGERYGLDVPADASPEQIRQAKVFVLATLEADVIAARHRVDDSGTDAFARRNRIRGELWRESEEVTK